MRQLPLALLLIAALVGCSDRGISDQPEGAGTPAASGTATPANNPPPSDIPLISSRQSTTQAMPQIAPPTGTAVVAADGAINAAGLLFSLPADWQSVPPASSMRLVQATVPGGGDLTVFHFGVGGGGGVDANIERWIAQFEVAAGTTPVRDRFENGGLIVHVVEVSGTMLPSGMGMGPAVPMPGSRLLGAVVEGPGGPWFFKTTGPDAAMTAGREAFLAMLRAATAG